MIQQLRDYGLNFDKVPFKCDNSNIINLSKDPVQHSRTKLIKIRHHFLKDHVLKGDIKLEFIPTKEQFADIFIKPLPSEGYCKIQRKLGMFEKP